MQLAAAARPGKALPSASADPSAVPEAACSIAASAEGVLQAERLNRDLLHKASARPRLDACTSLILDFSAWQMLRRRKWPTGRSNLRHNA